MAVNFTKNQDEITKAWRQVVDLKDSQNWALFGYEGNTNNLKLMSTDSNGLKGLVQEFNCSLIQYAFCRVIDKELGINKLVLINWQGDSSPLSRKGLCASHVGDVVSYFKGCSQTITIRNDDEATPEYLMDQIVKASSSRMNLPKQINNVTNNVNANIGSSYNKTDISSEISSDRKSFWQRQEEEEKERLREEKRRAAEKQAQFEKERKLREELEAKKLAETIKERDRIIEATRQAERRESSSSSSQPSSILTSNASQDNDDERVGRRSELIRLERNQETLSLIGKGLIKNKRAIFEQASQQQQNSQQPVGYTTTRRTSGAMITERLNTLKSLDGASSSANTNVDKLVNGFAKQVNLDDSAREKTNFVKKEVEAVKFISAEQEPISQSIQTVSTGEQLADEVKVDKKKTNSIQDSPKLAKNEDIITSGDSLDSNGNDNLILSKSPKTEPRAEVDIANHTNGGYGIRARALYDYQAADNTEISFDPDDIIGFIEKVDEGWWQGSVVTGPYKGQTGLFPSNYVEELN